MVPRNVRAQREAAFAVERQHVRPAPAARLHLSILPDHAVLDQRAHVLQHRGQTYAQLPHQIRLGGLPAAIELPCDFPGEIRPPVLSGSHIGQPLLLAPLHYNRF